VKKSSGNEKLSKQNAVNVVIGLAVSVMLLFSLLNLMFNYYWVFVADIVIALITLSAYFFSKRGRFISSYFILFILIPVLLLYYPLYIGNIGTEYYYFAFLALVFYFFRRIPTLIYYTLFYAVLFTISRILCTSFVNEQYILLETWHYYPSLVISVLSVLLSIFVFNRDFGRYEKQIELKNMDLAQKVSQLDEQNGINLLLLNELNHRIKNNLQQISSILKIESVNSSNTETKEALTKTRNRVYALSIIYKKLYNNTFNKKVRLYEYIVELIQNICDSYEILNDSFEIIMDDTELEMQHCINIGLIINELITNALKYSGKLRNELRLVIDIDINDNQTVFLRFRDNGKGFTELSEMGNNGLKLIRLLLSKNAGTINLSNSNGACVKIIYPVTDMKQKNYRLTTPIHN